MANFELLRYTMFLFRLYVFLFFLWVTSKNSFNSCFVCKTNF